MTLPDMLIDTNVLIYHLMQSDEDMSPRSSGVFRALQRGQATAYLPITAVFECVHVCQQTYDVPNEPLAHALAEILGFTGLTTDHREVLTDALNLWRDQGPLSFADCFHLALTKQLSMTRILTFDKTMDRYPGVERIEP